MSKKNFVSLVLGTVGGILFALGMCMTLLAQWGLLKQGIVIGMVGVAVLIAMLLARRKMEGKPIIIQMTGKTIGTIVLSAAGAIMLGIGMCLVMVWGHIVWGVIVGMIGIVLLLFLIPMVKGIK